MSIPSWAVKGAKVICIDTTGFLDQWQGTFPVKGEVYTVASGDAVHHDAIFLVECPPDRTGMPCSWSVRRFRPVRTIEDDISEHFAQHLTVRGRAPVEMAS